MSEKNENDNGEGFVRGGYCPRYHNRGDATTRRGKIRDRGSFLSLLTVGFPRLGSKTVGYPGVFHHVSCCVARMSSL